MPSYDLSCDACGHGFEVFRQGFLRDEDRTCPECGAAAARQLFTGFVTAKPSRGGGASAPVATMGGGGGGGCCGGSCGCG
ncbi:MAG: zinc ribbon domain-containing protein [Thermoleophilia bacterium]|nr:zinc ribbon domain-containing protein [Thermoleophilia bacterium]